MFFLFYVLSVYCYLHKNFNVCLIAPMPPVITALRLSDSALSISLSYPYTPDVSQCSSYVVTGSPGGITETFGSCSTESRNLTGLVESTLYNISAVANSDAKQKSQASSSSAWTCQQSFTILFKIVIICF